MTQYIFIHTDIKGQLWKHVHFSYISAVKARNAWASMSSIVTAISRKIFEEPRTVDKPCIIGRTINTIIPIEES